MHRNKIRLLLLAAAVCLPAYALSQTSSSAPATQAQIAALQQAVQNAQSAGDNAWMLVSAALVLPLWSLLVYCPMAHMVWGIGGLLNAFGGRFPSLDFAGGTVVHVTSGVSALVTALYLGKRIGYPKTAMPPHSMVLSFIGACLLWVGWFGFNAGSALNASPLATSAF